MTKLTLTILLAATTLLAGATAPTPARCDACINVVCFRSSDCSGAGLSCACAKGFGDATGTCVEVSGK